ncbi:MAG: flippase-like domain-containing protein [bacterium]
MNSKLRPVLLWLVTLMTLGSGILNLYSVIGPALPERKAILEKIFPLEFLHLSRFITVLVGFALFRPVIYRFRTAPHEHARAAKIVSHHGRSALDFFKTWPDKSIFFAKAQNSFVAYRHGANFAVALGDPVGPESEMEQTIEEFMDFCRENDWGIAFHQTLPDFLPIYKKLGFRKLKIGDDAVVDLTAFSLSGNTRREMRQTVHRLEKSGILTVRYEPPVPDEVLAQLRELSDEWLRIPGRRERRFTLGLFEPHYVRSTPVLTAANKDGKILAFVNTVPSYLRGETTIDLMRRRTSAPNGIMDYLFVKLFLHATWVFHDIHVERLWQSFLGINWCLIVAAVFFDILSYYCQGLRWELLLRPQGKISSLRTTQAIYAGLFTNEIVPLRPGELVRAYLVSRWLPARFVTVIPSMAVERMFDGVWLALAIAIAASFVPLPKNLLEAEEILGLVVLIAISLFVYLVFGKHRAREERQSAATPGWKSRRVIIRFLENLRGELRNIGTSPYAYISFGVSVLILVFQIIAFWLVMITCGLPLSLWAGAVILLIVHIGTAIPNAPSNVGTYQFFSVLGLQLFGIDKTPAAGFSVVVFMVLTIPLWVLGLLALVRSDMTLHFIRSEISKMMGKAEKAVIA